MSGRMREWARRAGVLAVVAVGAGLAPLALPAQPVGAAATTTVGFWSMDEPAGETVLRDSSGRGRHGTIGAEVVPGTRVLGATAHRFPWVPTAAPPAHPEHLDRIPDHISLDPETADYAVTVRYRTTENFGNIVQKGQNATIGGYWKFEAPQGIVTCLFKGASGAQRAVGSITALNDGEWHTVRCERTAQNLTMYVDGAYRNRISGTMGNISNSREVTIGGKGNCDQIEITCDYFVGDIDYVRIEKGSGGPANQAPVPSFQQECVGLVCSFSSTSTDADGAIQTYAWDFGDGGTGQWSTVGHTFPAEGAYDVTLTVTDDRGAIRSTTERVEVAPIPEIISFVGQGTANANVINHSVRVPTSVEPGDALLLFFAHNNSATVGSPAGVDGFALLDSVTGGYGSTRVWRTVAEAGDAGDTITVPLSRQAKGTLTVLAYRGTDQVDPVDAFARVADTTSSASRTTPTADVVEAQSWAVSYWMHGDSASTSLTPPSGVTPRAGGSQSGGGRVTTLVADSAASLPTGPYGGLVATAAVASTTSTAWTIVLDPASAPAPNQPPTAAITADCTGFDCTFTGSGSTDPDGAITAYAWDFGDGTTASAADPAVHTYAAAGEYGVTLTVTDDAGDSHQAQTTVTVPVEAPTEAIQFVGANTSNANATRHSVVVPDGVEEGDGLLLFFAENTTATISDPAGWTVLDSITAGSSTVRVWRKVAGPADARSTITVDLSAISKAGLTVAAYRGTSLTDPVATFARSAFSSSSVSRTTPVAPVAGERSWAVSYWTHKDSSTSALTPPEGVAVRASGSQTSGGRVTTLVADSGAMVPAGTYGGLTATGAAASSSASTWTIVLAPEG